MIRRLIAWFFAFALLANVGASHDRSAAAATNAAMPHMAAAPSMQHHGCQHHPAGGCPGHCNSCALCSAAALPGDVACAWPVRFAVAARRTPYPGTGHIQTLTADIERPPKANG